MKTRSVAIAVLMSGAAVIQSASADAFVPARHGRPFSGTGAGGLIADGSGTNIPGVPFRSTVTVPHGYAGPISDVWVEFQGLEHTWPGDLRARLIHPDGVTSVDLFSRPGRGAGEVIDSNTYGVGSDFDAANSYSFSDNGTILFLLRPSGGLAGGWQHGPLIPTGIYRPTTNPNPPDSNALDYDGFSPTPMSFAATFGGKSAVGDWTLEITDWAENDMGALGGWTLNVCSGGCPAAPASLGDELFKLTAFRPALGWEFGSSIALSGNTAIIGSPGYSGAGSFLAGSAYLFDVTTGRQLALLPPSDDIGELVRFGFSVAISGHTALVGALYDRVDVVGTGFSTGSVYVYDVSDPAHPVERRKLIPSDATGDFSWEFGNSVAISGNLAVVGAPAGGALTSRARGTVYLFDVRTGRELAKFTASEAGLGDGFGERVAISGHTVIVGTYEHVGYTGAAYLFDVSDPRHPVERFQLTASDARVGQEFGGPVAISGNLALVGATFDDDRGPYAGAAYLFDVTTGQQLAKVTASNGMEKDEFGWSVALSGSTALVGSPFTTTSSRGTAYMFDVSDPHHPVELAILSASDTEPADWYGLSVALSGDTALVGATQDFFSGGKAFVYRGRSSH